MFRSIALASALIFIAPGLASAGDVCVSCANPSAIYKCSADKAAKLEKYGIEDKVLPPVCAQVLAKLGDHESCQAVGKSGDPCEGIAKTIGLADLQKAASGSSGDSVVPSLGERAGSAAESAGETIGGVFKKSWNCVTSLFQECG
jgi:hypothetical protein